MGIIGIVSALTLPNLNSSTGDRERVAKVKKIFIVDEENKTIGVNCQTSPFTNLVKLAYGLTSCCTRWILLYDNADYLKFKNDSGLCPNGTTVSEANPRCK